MTYILGWKYGHSVYVVADTAVTWIRPTTHEAEQAARDRITSFGELIVTEDERVVREGALKLVHMDRLAVAFCGDIPTARSVLETLAVALRHGMPPRVALESALNSIGPFTDPNSQIHLIVGFPESSGPSLLAFNIDGDHSIHEVQDQKLVQFGSTPILYKNLSAQFLTTLKVFEAEPARLLVSALAMIQSYGIHGYLLPEGVGGCFVGLSIDRNQIHWQPDVLYVLHADLDPHLSMVSSIVRDHVHVVRSNLTQNCSYFGDSVNAGLNDEWRRRWWDPAFDFPQQATFDFVVLLNIAARIITVVEMLRQGESEYFRINSSVGEGPEEAFRLNMAMSPLVTQAVIRRTPDRQDGSIPFSFNWFPFSPGKTL